MSGAQNSTLATRMDAPVSLIDADLEHAEIRFGFIGRGFLSPPWPSPIKVSHMFHADCAKCLFPSAPVSVTEAIL